MAMHCCCWPVCLLCLALARRLFRLTGRRSNGPKLALTTGIDATAGRFRPSDQSRPKATATPAGGHPQGGSVVEG
jgi:hypothetical protein